MYIEIHNYEDINQAALYYKLNSAINIDSDDGLNKKICGIYAIYNNDICLYVGQSKNIASRIATHIRGKYNKATEIYAWDIENIGFSNYKERTSAIKSKILDNCEKYLMSKLKPTDNLMIDMDFVLDDDKTPDICFESCSDITFILSEYMLIITDSYSHILEDVDICNYRLHQDKQIDDKTFNIIARLVKSCEPKDFSKIGIKNEK